MIPEWFMGLGTQIVTWLLNLFPDFEPAQWFVDIGATVNGFMANLSGLGAWANWPLIAVCVSSVLLAWGIFGSVKLARVGVSHVPGVGGSG